MMNPVRRLRISMTVKFLIAALCAVTASVASFAASAQPALRGEEVVCTANNGIERLPAIVRFRIRSTMEIDARAFDRAGNESKSSILKRTEAQDRFRAAVFLMGGQLGVSGDVRLLIAQAALEFGDVGTIMIINHSTRESLAYQCVKQGAKEV